MTSGERWAESAYNRLAAYCRARGWRCSEPWRVRSAFPMSLPDQHLVTVEGVEIAYIPFDPPYFLDDYGRPVEWSAEAFDVFTASVPRRYKPSKKQLAFNL